MDNKNDLSWKGIKIIVCVTILIGLIVAGFGLYDLSHSEEAVVRIKTKKQCRDMIKELFDGRKKILSDMLKEDILPSYVVKTDDGYIINYNDTLWLVNYQALEECL